MTVENIQPEPSSNSSTVQENAITKNEPDVSEPATKPAENSFMAPHLKPLRLKLLKAFWLYFRSTGVPLTTEVPSSKIFECWL